VLEAKKKNVWRRKILEKLEVWQMDCGDFPKNIPMTNGWL
jgi:hypothetical protein